MGIQRAEKLTGIILASGFSRLLGIYQSHTEVSTAGSTTRKIRTVFAAVVLATSMITLDPSSTALLISRLKFDLHAVDQVKQRSFKSLRNLMIAGGVSA